MIKQQCPSCISLYKKLKILQADCDFQIKKLNEDRSAQKALYELHMSKEIKKLQEKFQKEKEDRAKQNQAWMLKYDELLEKQKLEITLYKNQKDVQLEQFKKSKDFELQEFMKQKVLSLEKNIEVLKLQKQQLKILMTQQHQNEIQLLTSSQNQKLTKELKKNEEQKKSITNHFQNVILGIQSQKTTEENLHQRTKQERKEIQSRLYQEIYSLKKNLLEYQEEIAKKKTQIKQKDQQIQSLHQTITQKQSLHQKKYQELSQDYQDKCRKFELNTENRIELLFKKQFENCTKYQRALQKIEEHRQIQNQMYKANLNEIKNCIDERPSRLQDVESILALKQKLTKKQNQCQNLSEQLRWYRLELQNKEETYNKIFGPDSKNNDSIYIRRKDLKLKRIGKSVTTVREILGASGNNLAPLHTHLQKKLLPHHPAKIL